MSDKVYLQVDRFLRPEEFEYLEKQFKKKDENIVLLPQYVKLVKPVVIRCKDCKYFHHSGECMLFRPRLEAEDKGEAGFCAWAERREE